MEISFQFNFKGMVLKDSNKAIRIFEEELGKLFEEGLVFLHSRVLKGTPIWQGHLSEGIFRSSIKGTGLNIHGTTFTNIVYGQFIEEGFPIHAFPNFQNLADWVKAKLNLTGKDLYLVTRVISRKIASYGIKGRFMFKKAFEEGQIELPKMVARAEKRIVERWDKE
jgi:hypothetical protein